LQSGQEELFSVKTTEVIEMKENDIDAPYAFMQVIDMSAARIGLIHCVGTRGVSLFAAL